MRAGEGDTVVPVEIGAGICDSRAVDDDNCVINE